MSNIVKFSYDNVPFVFLWIKGTKTINIAFPDALETHIDSISFDHEKSETTFERAEEVIKQYLKDNGYDTA